MQEYLQPYQSVNLPSNEYKLPVQAIKGLGVV